MYKVKEAVLEVYSILVLHLKWGSGEDSMLALYLERGKKRRGGGGGYSLLVIHFDKEGGGERGTQTQLIILGCSTAISILTLNLLGISLSSLKGLDRFFFSVRMPENPNCKMQNESYFVFFFFFFFFLA